MLLPSAFSRSSVSSETEKSLGRVCLTLLGGTRIHGRRTPCQAPYDKALIPAEVSAWRGGPPPPRSTNSGGQFAVDRPPRPNRSSQLALQASPAPGAWGLSWGGCSGYGRAGWPCGERGGVFVGVDPGSLSSRGDRRRPWVTCLLAGEWRSRAHRPRRSWPSRRGRPSCHVEDAAEDELDPLPRQSSASQDRGKMQSTATTRSSTYGLHGLQDASGVERWFSWKRGPYLPVENAAVWGLGGQSIPQ